MVTDTAKTSESMKRKDEPQESQKKRVDSLLMELVKHFPPKVVQSKVTMATSDIMQCVVILLIGWR